MKTKILLRTIFTLVLGLLITVTNASGQQVRYRVIDLGENSTANDITDSGQIAGSKNFGARLDMPYFGLTPTACRLISGHCRVTWEATGLG